MNKKSFLFNQNVRYGLIFISPWLIGFFCFRLYPIAAAFYYSFCQFDSISPPKWIFLQNFKTLFFKDEYFWLSLYNTLYYSLFSVSGQIILAFLIALLLNLRVKGLAIYRTIFYIPSIVPIVATAILWLWILNPQFGLVNALLFKIGVQGPGWFSEPAWAKPGLVIMSWWLIGPTVIIYLAGLQDVPQQMYEAAMIDGANWWHKLVYITIPFMTPTIFFTLVMNTIVSLQVFTQVYIMTEGGPMNSTLVYAYYLYENAFEYFKMGYASAMAWLLFLVIFTITYLIFKSSKKWVYYGG